MYSHHHYNYENLPRENDSAHHLGRLESMPSIYQPEKDLDVEPTTRSSLDIASTTSGGPYTGSWQTQNSCNQNTDNSSVNNSTPNKDDKHASTISAYNHSPTYFVSPSTNSTASTGTPVYNGQYQNSHHSSNNYSGYNVTSGLSSQPRHSLVARPRLTTTLWEDEGTICYQVDANGICVARRQDNDMINGTKLLNVAGMSRGKRDGILKNEKGRVVVKVGAMHLKGVWITFARAKLLAAQYKIQEILYPLFVDDPSVFLYATALHNPMATSRMNNFNNRQSNFQPVTTSWDKSSTNTNETHGYRNAGFHNSSMINHPMNSHNDDMFILSSQVDYSRTTMSGYSNHYSLYPQQQQERRLYFSDNLLENNKLDNNSISNEPATTNMYTQKIPGTTTFSSPTSSEAGTATNTNERRQSLVMSSSRASPRHHPYMSPGKVYPPSIMSSLQSYREDNRSILNETNRNSIDNSSTTETDRHPW